MPEPVLATIGDVIRGAMLLGIAGLSIYTARKATAAHRRGLERVRRASIPTPSHVRVIPAQRTR